MNSISDASSSSSATTTSVPKSSSKIFMIVGITIGVVALLLIALCIYCYKAKKMACCRGEEEQDIEIPADDNKDEEEK